MCLDAGETGVGVWALSVECLTRRSYSDKAERRECSEGGARHVELQAEEEVVVAELDCFEAAAAVVQVALTTVALERAWWLCVPIVS